VTVARGQQVVVRLPENPTTGYRWEPPADVEVVSDEFHPAAGTGIGAGGERVFTLAARAPTAEVRFALMRPWGGGSPERVFTLRLTAS